MPKHMLYVEDEESDVFLLKFAFQRLGITDPFQVAVDGEQAIEYLAGTGQYADRQRFPFPSLVLLDLNLPRRNGFEVLEWRRQHPLARKVPVVIFTSSSCQRDVQRAYELGAFGYLTKVPNPADWAKRARAIRDFWLEYNIPPPLCPASPAHSQLVA